MKMLWNGARREAGSAKRKGGQGEKDKVLDKVR
jgi:hypothetical protein